MVIEICVCDGHTVDEVTRTTALSSGTRSDFAHSTAATRMLYKQIRGSVTQGWLACLG